MTKRAWMPLYVGDYLGDTGHLSTSQHGAYLLLMMHYWRQGGLPHEDKQLAAITKMPLRIWLDCRDTIQAFFIDGWRHKRIEQELAKMQTAADKRANAGQKGGLRAAMNRMALADAASHSIATPRLQHGARAAGLDHSHSHKNIISSSTVSVERAKESKQDGSLATAQLDSALREPKEERKQEAASSPVAKPVTQVTRGELAEMYARKAATA